MYNARDFWRVCYYFCSQAAGLSDPAFNVLPATLLVAAADKALLRGALFETALRAAFPEYKTKVWVGGGRRGAL